MLNLNLVAAATMTVTLLGLGCAHKQVSADSTPAEAPAVAKTPKQVEAKTAPEKAKNGEIVECVHAQETRKLEVRAKDGGCELAYTKAGGETVVSSSHKGKKHCQDSLAKIEEKLTAAGYNCK